jgi:hypothetical protein
VDALRFTIAKVILVTIGTKNPRHGGDVESEQATANCGETAYSIDRVECLYHVIRVSIVLINAGTKLTFMLTVAQYVGIESS